MSVAASISTQALGNILDFDAKYNFDDQGVWADYMIKSRYERDPHTYMAGVASPGGFQGASVAFFRLTAPTLLWIVDWTAARFATQPDIPSNEPQGNNWVLLDEIVEPAMITVGPDGVTPLYRISGTYVYGNINPSADVLKNVSYGRPPWLQNNFDRSMPTSLEQKDLMDSSSVAAQQQGNFQQ